MIGHLRGHEGVAKFVCSPPERNDRPFRLERFESMNNDILFAVGIRHPLFRLDAFELRLRRLRDYFSVFCRRDKDVILAGGEFLDVKIAVFKATFCKFQRSCNA